MPLKLWKNKGLSKFAHQATDGTPIRHPTTWTAEQSNGLWQNRNGRRIQFSAKPLIQLSDIERRHLKVIAHHKLQNSNLGHVTVPRDLSEYKKKKGWKLKGGCNKATNFFDSLRDGKDAKDVSPLIFGIPLEKCLQNDEELRILEANRSHERRESLDLAQPVMGLQTRIKSSRSLHSPQLSRKSSASSTALLEALSLSSTVNESHRRARRQSLAPNADLKIPRVVSDCLAFIEKHGLRTEGIFRVNGSKKRLRQMREAYDNGNVVTLQGNQSPYDIGALLKEYFRDLPEPLLTRDLYTVFTNAIRIEDPLEKLTLFRLAICLLPVVHRDTLYSLLRFLSRVAAAAERDAESSVTEGAGSKMNSQNLATLFGPNILRKTKGGINPDKDFQVDSSSQVERTHDIIMTVRYLIDNVDDIFEIPVQLQEDVINMLKEEDPEAFQYILDQKSFEMSHLPNSMAEEPDVSYDGSPADTTSSSGTFPCIVEDSSLASLSTIEDLVNENNLSDFESNVPFRGSSDSIAALEEDCSSDRTIPEWRHFFDDKPNQKQFSSEPDVDESSRDEQNSNILDEIVCKDSTASVTDDRVSQSPSPRNSSQQSTNVRSALMPPVVKNKRNSIGLYAETMIALGINVSSPAKSDSSSNTSTTAYNRDVDKETNLNSIEASKKETINNSFQYPLQPSSFNENETRDQMISNSNIVSSSPSSGSTSSSNVSLTQSDASIESTKKLPKYSEVQKIKELGVKSYVTVNSKKFFIPVPSMNEDVKSSQLTCEEEKKDNAKADEDTHRIKHNLTNSHELTPLDDRFLPPYSPSHSSNLKRREHISKSKHPPAYIRPKKTTGAVNNVNDSNTNGQGWKRDKSSPVHLYNNYPPKISLYTWDFLDMSTEDDGQFDGPETIV